MGRSIGLAAYRLLSRRSAERAFKPSMKRPEGALLWIHAAETGSLLALHDLAQRLCLARPDLNIMISVPDQKDFDALRENWVPQERVSIERLPSEHPDAIQTFWSHWSPDFAIWVWGDLRPNLLVHVHQEGCPIALIDADEEGFDRRRDRWLPDLSRHLLDPFVALLARSSGALRKLESLGLNGARIDVTPRLEAGGHALPCLDSDLSDLSRNLSGRPVWLANTVQEEELEQVLTAHRMALRLSHRLLLILHPAHGALLDSFIKEVTSQGLRQIIWGGAQDIDDATQVLLVPDHGDLGLFYRVAPVSFMGSSLAAGYGGRNPFEAAALGSAVLYGPNVRRFMPFYSRLANAGAARIVKDAETLGAAVTQLIAPDRAAAMAHAGWDVTSEGADLTDRVIELVHKALDGELEGRDARP